MSEAKRGQGAFEYILMLSGVPLIVILIIFILQGTLAGANNTMGAQQNTFTNSVSIDVVPQYTQCLIVTSNGNGITAGAPCCSVGTGTLTLANCVATTGGCYGVTAACTGTLNCPTSKFDRKTGKCA